MSFEYYILIGAATFVFLVIAVFAFLKTPKRLKHDYFVTRWKKLQQLCPDEALWAQAIQEADNLLDEALRKKKFKGKSMGERLVSAQKHFTNNDALWFGHKLRTKLDANPDLPLQQADVQRALLGLRQGLKDVGAL